MKQISLTKRILVPVTLTFGLLLGAFIYNVYQVQTDEISVDVERHLQSTEKLYDKQLDAEVKLLSSIAEIISGNPLLQEAWLSQDRKTLLDLSLPILADLNRQLEITHFYYHGLNRVNFLRVYNPGRHGDTITRFTAIEAEKTGQVSAGVELGKLGTLTLRVVHPWRINGEIVGYIELGEEIDHIIDKLHEILGIELYVSIYKNYLNKERWEKGMQLLGRQSSWDLIPDSVIVNHTPQEIPAVFRSFLTKGQHEYMEMAAGIRLSIDGGNFRAGVVPLYDAGSQEVGDIVVLYDVSSKMASSQRTIVFTIILCSLAGVILFFFYSNLLRKLDTKLSLYQNNLEDMVQERTDELALSKIQLEQEVAERKLAEVNLREREDLLQSIFRSAPVGIGLVVSRVLNWVNDELLEMTGYMTEDLKDMSSRIFYPSDEEFDRVGREKYDQIKKYGTGTVETIWQKKDGALLNVLLSSTPIDPADLSKGITFTALDITSRKRAETDLASEKEQLSVTLRSIGDGVITTDTRGNIVLINKIAEGLTGWSQQEVLGKPVNEVFRVINEKTGTPRESPIENVLATGTIINLANHTALIAKDGTIRNIADSGAPIRDDSSNIIGVILVFRDVTEQKMMEKELLKVKKLESLGVLAGGIAHDFNNILVSILGNINLATYSLDPDDKIYPILKDAEKASMRAKDLTMQLLTFSKGGDPVKETASVPEIIKDSAGFVLRGGNVSCDFDMPADLWFVEMDKGQISQVIQNLIINAAHAMPTGGKISVSCRNINNMQEENIPGAERLKNYVKIALADTGIGIPESIIERIFDPYFSTKQDGSGLGLAISHSIVSKHNGYITVRSEPGSGTVFNVYLPSSEKKLVGSSEDSANSPLKGGLKIMVMDDDPAVRDTLQAMLSELGYQAVLANNGEQALRQYIEDLDSDDPIDIIILDLTIPGGMGGEETAKGILAISPHAKIIVSSGYSNDPVMANSKEHGFVAAIVKPYQLHELQTVISKVST